jgi:hypothetical protein
LHASADPGPLPPCGAAPVPVLISVEI